MARLVWTAVRLGMGEGGVEGAEYERMGDRRYVCRFIPEQRVDRKDDSAEEVDNDA